MEGIMIMIPRECNCLGFWSSCLCFIFMTLYYVWSRERLDTKHGNSCGGDWKERAVLESRYGRQGKHCNSVLSKPQVQKLTVWEIVKGNLLNRRAARWTIFDTLILTCAPLNTCWKCWQTQFFFFRMKTGECNFLGSWKFSILLQIS